MTWQIALIFLILVLALISFAWEKIPPDLTSLSVFGILLVTGILTERQAFSVFSNPAPITVGAMFIISASLERTGIIDLMAHWSQGLVRLGYTPFLFVMIVGVGAVSAFINNTPVVVVFLPVVLSLGRQLKVPASKLLIPLSYASILGGMCTLIGTSTNILVSGIAQQAGEQPLSMFELGRVGVPVLLAGTAYLLIFGRRLLPTRETLSSILTPEERREYITEAFVQPDSPVVGKTLAQASLLKSRGIRVIEIVREGTVLQMPLSEILLKAGDRVILACRPSGIAHARSLEGVDFVAETGLGLEQIAAHEGMLVEGVIGPNASIIGKTIMEINFRQRFRMIILAIHRRGHNVRDQLERLKLQFGDTLLLLGTEAAIQNLRNSDDVLLLDRPAIPTRTTARKAPLAVAIVAGVIASASFGIAPIEVSAITGCILLLLTGCLRPKDAYSAIQWNLLFLIFGMLALGTAMESTGASKFIAHVMVGSVDYFVPVAYKPIVMLACIYIVTTMLTEILSNNAAAVVMVTLAIGIAGALHVDPRPFVVVVAIAASASFATPIGYQTNTYVYGVGGYRFSDFVKIGLPMNVICFIAAMIVVPIVWHF